MCKDISAEPQLQQLNGETLQPSTLTGNAVRLDICARGFWQTGQMVRFFDVRVFNPNAKIYVNQDISPKHANFLCKRECYTMS